MKTIGAPTSASPATPQPRPVPTAPKPAAWSTFIKATLPPSSHRIHGANNLPPSHPQPPAATASAIPPAFSCPRLSTLPRTSGVVSAVVAVRIARRSVPPSHPWPLQPRPRLIPPTILLRRTARLRGACLRSRVPLPRGEGRIEIAPATSGRLGHDLSAQVFT